MHMLAKFTPFKIFNRVVLVKTGSLPTNEHGKLM
jgi:hypothetical protein